MASPTPATAEPESRAGPLLLLHRQLVDPPALLGLLALEARGLRAEPLELRAPLPQLRTELLLLPLHGVLLGVHTVPPPDRLGGKQWQRDRVANRQGQGLHRDRVADSGKGTGWQTGRGKGGKGTGWQTGRDKTPVAIVTSATPGTPVHSINSSSGNIDSSDNSKTAATAQA
jgi:hypothetical protein